MLAEPDPPESAYGQPHKQLTPHATARVLLVMALLSKFPGELFPGEFGGTPPVPRLHPKRNPLPHLEYLNLH